MTCNVGGQIDDGERENRPLCVVLFSSGHVAESYIVD